MATRRYAIGRGETLTDITQGAGEAVDAKAVEVTIDLEAGMARSEVIRALDYLKSYILENNWPPA